MSRLWLVRHGHAAASWGEHADPGLDERGRAEAEAVATRLAPAGPLPVLASPLRRTRETAEPLADRWGVAVEVEPLVAEVPSPTDVLDERARWLEGFLAGRWRDAGPVVGRWRDDVVGWCRAQRVDEVVVTHFVVINAVIGAATGDDRVVARLVANGSVTVVDVGEGGSLTLVEGGAEAASEVG